MIPLIIVIVVGLVVAAFAAAAETSLTSVEQDPDAKPGGGRQQARPDRDPPAR